MVINPQPGTHTRVKTRAATRSDWNTGGPPTSLGTARGTKVRCRECSKGKKKKKNDHASSNSFEELHNTFHDAVCVGCGRFLLYSRRVGCYGCGPLIRTERPLPDAHLHTPFPGLRRPDSSDLDCLLLRISVRREKYNPPGEEGGHVMWFSWNTRSHMLPESSVQNGPHCIHAKVTSQLSNS